MGGVLAKRVIKNLHALMSNHGGFWPACAIFKVVCIARIVFGCYFCSKWDEIANNDGSLGWVDCFYIYFFISFAICLMEGKMRLNTAYWTIFRR